MPGLEFSHTIAFVPGPQGSAAPATEDGGKTVAIRAATTVKRPYRSNLVRLFICTSFLCVGAALGVSAARR
ncbi:hypothetical protein GCM10017778_22550 [Streptomyces vinaceus]|nr:hypothetical protein GCM10017778_22550 [Streptomyces vinaceus]